MCVVIRITVIIIKPRRLQTTLRLFKVFENERRAYWFNNKNQNKMFRHVIIYRNTQQEKEHLFLGNLFLFFHMNNNNILKKKCLMKKKKKNYF